MFLCPHDILLPTTFNPPSPLRVCSPIVKFDAIKRKVGILDKKIQISFILKLHLHLVFVPPPFLYLYPHFHVIFVWFKKEKAPAPQVY